MSPEDREKALNDMSPEDRKKALDEMEAAKQANIGGIKPDENSIIADQALRKGILSNPNLSDEDKLKIQDLFNQDLFNFFPIGSIAAVIMILVKVALALGIHPVTLIS